MNWKRANALIEQSENVMRLPTAAPRQVHNNTYKDQREAAWSRRAETAHLFGYQRHGEREAEQMVEIINSTQVTPALILIEEIFNTMTREERKKLADGMKKNFGHKEDAAYRQAVTFAHCKAMTGIEMHDLVRAFKKLNKRQIKAP